MKHIPEGCLSIGDRAFANCKNLVYIHLPSTLNSIAENAFDGSSHVCIDHGK